MTNQEYWDIANEMLVEAWKNGGKSAYSPVQLTMLGRALKDIKAEEFRSALENLAMNVARAPTIAQVKSACISAINRARTAIKNEKMAKLQFCTMCGLSGWVNAYKAAEPLYEFSFICSCEAAVIIGYKTDANTKYWRDASANPEWKVVAHTMPSLLSLKADLAIWRLQNLPTAKAIGFVDMASGEKIAPHAPF